MTTYQPATAILASITCGQTDEALGSDPAQWCCRALPSVKRYLFIALLFKLFLFCLFFVMQCALYVYNREVRSTSIVT